MDDDRRGNWRQSSVSTQHAARLRRQTRSSASLRVPTQNKLPQQWRSHTSGVRGVRTHPLSGKYLFFYVITQCYRPTRKGSWTGMDRKECYRLMHSYRKFLATPLCRSTDSERPHRCCHLPNNFGSRRILPIFYHVPIDPPNCPVPRRDPGRT